MVPESFEDPQQRKWGLGSCPQSVALSPTALNPEGCWAGSIYMDVADPQGEATVTGPTVGGRGDRAGERNRVDTPPFIH